MVTRWTSTRVLVMAVLANLGTAPLAAQTAPTTTLSGQAQPAGGSSHGITVHGHWVIQIERPDGTVVERREFENALGLQGPQILAWLLVGRAAAGSWAVTLGDVVASADHPCVDSALGDSRIQRRIPCQIFEPIPPAAEIVLNPLYQSGNLAVTLGTGHQTVELTGSITASGGGTLQIVGTDLAVCVPANSSYATSSATDCRASASGFGVPVQVFGTEGGLFTRRSLGLNEIQVALGQTIRVWVTLSFS